MQKVKLSGNRIFYKSMNENLQGRNGFQYKVGETFEPNEENKDDCWNWLYFSDYLSSTIIHSGSNIRICEVNPLGEVYREKARLNGYNKGYNYSTNKLYIKRELSKEEIFDICEKEGCPGYMLLRLNPPFEILNRIKRMKKGGNLFKEYVIRNADLTTEQKKELLPKIWHSFV